MTARYRWTGRWLEMPGTRPLLTWTVLLAVYLSVTLSWAFSTPLFGSPDEVQHVYRAAAVVRGEVIVATHGPAKVSGDTVYVPRQIVDLGIGAGCFALRPSVPASCPQRVLPSSRLVPAGTGAARYNPVYYSLVGLPTLLDTGRAGLYGMRVVSCLLCSALLATAMLAALQLGPSLAAGGLTLALTPTAMFLSAMVNPNGLEIAAAAAVWTNLLLWVDRRSLSHQALGRATAAAVAMVLSRSISPLWLSVIVFCVALLAKRDWLRSVLLRRWTLGSAALVSAITLASVGWVLVSHELQIGPPGPVRDPLSGTSFGTRFAATASHVNGWFQQSISVLGWLTSPLPSRSYTLWAIAVLALLMATLLCRGYRAALVAIALAVIAIYLSRIIEAQQLGVIGRWWQGRYTLPLTVGGPVLLGAGARAVSARGRKLQAVLAAAIMLFCTALALLASVIFLHRNSSGVGTRFTLYGSWQPPLGPIVWLAVLGIGMLAIGLVSVGGTLVATTPDRPAAPLPPASHPMVGTVSA